ncbi:thiol reductant ABC exporter subunit CydD [Oryzisolibacter sp. LB2S]|uniref:thiol reductant ABC exporter subunit CydD n=1 Tax=Alicycliphilus soli TaxID=3228789 RepID=UPI003458A119
MSDSQLDAASLVHAISPILWLPQAALIALAVARLQSGSGLAGVLWPAAGIVFAGALRAWLEAWSAGRMFHTARERLSQWRADAFAALAARSPLDRDRAHAGTAASALAEQADAILPWQTRYQGAMWRVRLMPVLILLPVAWYSWAAAAVLVLAAPLIPMFMVIVGWRARAASQAQWLQMGSMNAFLLDRLRGLPTLRALGRTEATARRLRASAEDLRQRTMRVLRIAFLSSAVLELFAALGVAMVAAYVGFHLLGYLDFGAWGQRLGLAQGLFILLLAPAFFEPLRELASVWHDRAAGIAAMDALDGLHVGGLPLLDGAHSAPCTPQASAAGLPPRVRIENLAFAFSDETPVFQSFSLDVKPGEHVALLGGSGVGKTVLMSLIAGLLPASQGRIEIDGVALTATSARWLRERMAWMAQRSHVFSGSVRHNVSLGRAAVGDTQVRQAIQWARLDKVAQAYPGASLGEGGTGLSGGEAARLALARLMAAPHADLLLADEPTAHLDTETSEQVIESLVALAHRRTLIVATHDPALAARMDRVVDLSAAADVSEPIQGGWHGA